MLLLPGLTLLLQSCAGLEPSRTRALDEPDKTERGKRRDWVTGAPTMEGHFVGVGSSETGNLSEDRRLAEIADKLSEAVEANISGIELGDTYEDPEHGCWALVCRSKQRWAKQ